MSNAAVAEKPTDERIAKIQQRVVGMYHKHPWPGDRRSDEEMGWRLKCLGITPEDYVGKTVLELGCGTGDYALWYATHGAKHVTAVDLSDGSLARAREKAADGNVKNITFIKHDVLTLDLPSNSFDYVYSVGVMHITGDTFGGFKNLVRMAKPGAPVIFSVPNKFTRGALRPKQWICHWLGGNDLEARARWAKRLFPISVWRLKKRFHGLNNEELVFDNFALPHETIHTVGELLSWFDKTGVKYMGGFPPFRVQDYFFAFSQPEYTDFRKTFVGFPGLRFTSDALTKVSKLFGAVTKPPFPRPGMIQRGICQMAWMPFALRFYCYSIAGRKQQ
ncbi:MAG: class I SAM-dependent methyltransferase [Acidobacteria bacterium]|nr:class I SAM-dependent methyltransferase [Acidobacteriota bacterium]